jgi:Bacterial Ig-like domain
MVSMLQDKIDHPSPSISDPNFSPGVFSYALVCLYLNQNVAQANQMIVDFYTNNPIPTSPSSDGAGYFYQHIMWRVYHDPTAHSRLTTQARNILEANMRNWVFNRSTLAWAQESEWKIHDSENHDTKHKGSHLMCLIALKNSPSYGPNTVLGDGGSVAEHLNAWTSYYLRYFRARAMEGINVEIASPIYAKYTVDAYYNIMDFADSPELRALAKTFIDLYWADTVSDWVSSGVRGGGETRCYREGSYLKAGTTYAFYGLLWGYKWREGTGGISTTQLIPATSSYRVPDIITAIATDPARPNFLYSSRRFGRGGAWDSNKDYLVVFDNGNSNLRRDTWVTPDYSMGTLTVDMNKDYIALIDQNRVMGIMFASGPNDRIMVFGAGGSADTTKSFADISGVTRADCMIVQRDKNAYQTGTATQIFVAQNAWNNRVETGDWFFTQLGNAYCALRPAGGGYTSASTGSGYYLTLGDMWAPVIIQTGQAGNYASFTDFQNSVIANSLTFVSGTMNYTSEAGDTFTFYANSKTTPKVNGTTVNLNPAKTYDSPYLSMTHGQDIATVSYPGYSDLILDFGPPPVLTALTPADNGTTLASANLVATFDKPVQRGTGFITIKRLADNSTVQSFDAATSSGLNFAGATLTIDPAANLALNTAYYVTIDATAVTDTSGKPFEGIATNDIWNFTATAFSLVNTGSKVQLGPLGGTNSTLAFDAGAAADLLIVALTSEKGAGAYTVTYGGVALTPSVLGGSADIWHLDLTSTIYTGGAANLVVNYAGVTTVNGVGIGAISVTSGGQPLTLHSTAASLAGSHDAVSIPTTAQSAFVVTCFNANNTGAVSANAPLTQIFASTDVGSARGSAGYEANATAGSHTYSFTSTTPRSTVAAAFAWVSGVNNFSNWIAGFNVGGQTGLADDPDKDGIPSGVEQFFGTAPNVFSTGLLPGVASGNNFTFTHPQQGALAADLSASYRWSKDLVTYQASGATDGAGTRVDFTTQANTPSAGITTVTATVTGTPTARLFVIVGVTQN